MEIQFLVTLDFDPKTETFKVIEQKQVQDKVRKVSNKKTTVEETGEGIIILEENKICLNECAAVMLNVEAGDRIDVQYTKINNKMIPIIGSIESLGVSKGNKLTKGLTVSFRGNANMELVKYGSRFTFEDIAGKPKVFKLRGENEIATEEVNDDNLIEINSTAEIDIPFDTKLDITNEEIVFEEEENNELEDPNNFKL